MAMPSTHVRPLFFLQHQSAAGSKDSGQLNAEARAHVARQAALKEAKKPKTLQFITCGPGTKPRRNPYRLTGETDDPEGDRDIRHLRASHRCKIPLSPKKAASFDPFDSLAVPEPAREEQFLLHYAFNRTLPAFGESETYKRDFAHSWITRTMESPLVFYAQILGSSTHYSISSPGADGQSRIIRGLQRKIQAIKALRTKIEQYKPGSSGVDQGLLLAIFILAIHGNFDLTDRPEPHPLSPMATYRDMNIYGRMTFGEEHINALYYLVEQNGGISCVDPHAFGYVLPLFDIVYSARAGCVPRFSCPRQLEPLLGGNSWKPDAQASKMLTTYGQRLRLNPDGVIPIYLDQSLVKVFQVMSEVTVGLDHYCRGGEGAPGSLDVLLNNCDWAAHTTLSLSPYTSMPTEGEDGESGIDVSCTLREICRLCALLHVDMVLLPTPPHTGIKLRHAKSILRLLKLLDKQGPIEDVQVSEILTWATVLGAIATRFTELEGRYRTRVEKLAQKTAWDVVKPCFEQHLWFAPVYDGPACGLWREAAERISHGDEELTLGDKEEKGSPSSVD
ncbi:hypothetical protein NCS57_01380600 [Fusarium keratoplasticum]|uniref:Uncharacterized protein n=1 Tax=Fusarium keratoplasticum TaxID=1328300 RepID=A0ACC0QEF3_9HYPO|nr:hypothetical protein NCS57_01380600 [Fusarium keratoplasticum]KAI8650468.1 hypothetical protein NCS57_01380600 [Fusarium keratoplasticum]